MEILLQELSSASKLLTDFREMYEYENRLKTFTKWPFQENCKCTPGNMAKAGFIHCPSANEPDVAKCFFCLLELEGWEPNDDPWEKHAKHSTCDFLSLPKHFDELTMEEYYMLEMTRLRTFICKVGRRTINAFQEEVAATRQRFVDYFGCRPQLPAALPLRDEPAAQQPGGATARQNEPRSPSEV
ncbi:baculoviral IAP repeat-containing protein 5.1-like [Aphelocoma coerulescens]|uniref:baculoviral IAP repeat-containing protein 5.1-like n=1 Tax=Aphelocoma coerulescens TaxID=39617 RepID=UPI0036053E89